MTTHVGLTARALGADRVIFPDNAGQSAETVRDITDRFGGPFAVELRDDQKAIVRNFEGVVVHLTMYGERVKTWRETFASRSKGRRPPDRRRRREGAVGAVRARRLQRGRDEPAALRGRRARRVPRPAVRGTELDREWEDADRRVMPEATGKTVIDADEERSDGD